MVELNFGLGLRFCRKGKSRRGCDVGNDFEKWHQDLFGYLKPDSPSTKERKRGWDAALMSAAKALCATCDQNHLPEKNSDGEFMHLNGTDRCPANRVHQLREGSKEVGDEFTKRTVQ
jgi:hypothetical protein